MFVADSCEVSDEETLLHELLLLIAKSEKPVLYVGQGAADCPEALLKFAERFQIPVTTTLHAMGVFDERHPLALKMLGNTNNRGAAILVS